MMNGTKNCGTPIDFEHLRQFTAGDVALEREVLGVFVEQTDMWLRVLQQSCDGEAWKDAAHTLKGSARGVGAWKVAELCEKAEALANDGCAAERSITLGDLKSAVDDAVQFINGHLYEAQAS